MPSSIQFLPLFSPPNPPPEFAMFHGCLNHLQKPLSLDVAVLSQFNNADVSVVQVIVPFRDDELSGTEHRSQYLDVVLTQEMLQPCGTFLSRSDAFLATTETAIRLGESCDSVGEERSAIT
ncbi:hypothetical protein EYZ11_005388 [Aspergillus tanneri]|uniref:Uncharacterized protein n=1 Tax=Aspergillus tanneri TaxID=1220188 RepID=A0A4S3JIQ1_9EURO|nr:hypothetical protein EYZ11_005388 [Aspergillus tanneri]